MIHYFIYAKDFSGSTEDVSYYHTNGMKTVEQFKSDVEDIKKQRLIEGKSPAICKIIYLHWGDSCYEIDEDTTMTSYKQMASGNMGTAPETIIQWIQGNCNLSDKKSKIKLLYIITDGLIGPLSAQKCFELNKNMHYEKVVFHAFSQNLDQIDLSVAASFFKGQSVVYRNYQLFDNVDISKDYDYDKVNVENFKVEKEDLKSYIKLKFIKTGKHDAFALKEIDKLKNLRSRLFAELSSKSQKREFCHKSLETKDRNVFLSEFVNTDWYRNLLASEYDVRVDIEKSISTLINYIVSDAKSFSFDAVKFDNTFNKPVEEEPIVDVNFAAEQEIEFPDVILDDEKGIPVILLNKLNLLEKLIFHRTEESTDVPPASFSKFKSTMECPLFLQNDPDISESIGYFYTLNVYKQLLASNTETDPRTRRSFHGGLVLLDTDKFDKYNDYILSATYFNFKKVNFNIGLFYFVLWKNCENKQWMDKNVVERFKKYVMRRISGTVCKIGLSSLPLDPQENTSLPTALWYCLELSSSLFKDDPQKFIHERLRMFFGVADSMIEILKYFNYDLDLESIEKRIDLIRHVMILKRIPTRGEKFYYLLEKIFKNINGFLVSEIEKPHHLYKLNYLKLHHKGMLNDEVIKEKVHLNDYVHLMHCVVPSRTNRGVTVCEKTYRPFFTIDKEKSFYTELMLATRKVVINDDDNKNKIKISYEPVYSLEFDKILSLYNLFLNCVQDCEKYPTLSEYTEYILKKKKFKGDLVTIFPSIVCEDIEDMYNKYQSIVTKVDLTQFIDTCKRYVNRFDRVKAEGVVEFNTDCEINEFISFEEFNVALKKKGMMKKKKKIRGNGKLKGLKGNRLR